ncbi:MAG: ABC transporter substrate-binding protein [Candidatus Bathyarchaeia archaeon]
MKKKVIYAIIAVIVVVIAVVGVLYFYLIPAGEKYPTIKVGVITDLTGPFAEGGIRNKLIFEAYVKKINEEGGIHIAEYNRKLPVELVIVNYEGVAERALELAPKLIDESKVLAIICDMSPAEALPVAYYCEKREMICFVLGPLEMFLQNAPSGGWKYSWDIFPAIADLGKLDVLYAKRFEKDLGQIVVGMLLRDDADGRVVANVNIPIFEKVGFKVVFPGLFPPGTEDFFPIISKFKEEGVNVLFANCFITEFATFWRQCHMVGWKPAIAYGGRYIGRGPPDAKVIGEDIAEGISATTWWWWNWPFPGNDWIRETWPKITDLSPSVSIGHRVSVLMVVLNAIERAGKLDVKSINQALATTDVMVPIGRVRAEPNHTARTPCIMAQLQRRDREWDFVPVLVPDPAFGIPEQPAIFPLPGYTPTR